MAWRRSSAAIPISGSFNRLGATRLHRGTLDHDHAPRVSTRPSRYSPPDRGWGRHRQARLPPCAGDGRRASRCASSGPVVRRRCPKTGGRPCCTATTQELPRSPLGAYLRLPLVNESDGAIVYPYHVRHRVAVRSPSSGLHRARLAPRARADWGTWSARCSASAYGYCRRRVCRSTATVVSDGRDAVRLKLPGWLRRAGTEIVGATVPRPTEGDGDQTTTWQTGGQPGADRHGVHGYRARPKSDRLSSPPRFRELNAELD